MPQIRMTALALAGLATLAAPLALPGAARADQTDTAVFDVTLKGLRAATLSLSGRIEGGAYGAAGRLESSGIVAWIRSVSYDAESRGSVSGTRFTPARYREAADTGKRKSEAVMDYVRGTPQVKVYDPPRKPDEDALDPASQGGTVDPMTAIYAVLRDTPAAEACSYRSALFDGKRRTQVALSGTLTETGPGTYACAGEYRRLEGFSAEDMAEKTSFPFTLTYTALPDGRLRVTEISTDTIYGKGRLKRR